MSGLEAWAAIKLKEGIFSKVVPNIYELLKDTAKKVVSENEFHGLIEKYYNRVYSKYYYATTLLITNSRVPLNDIYLPLTLSTLIEYDEAGKNIGYSIDSFPYDLLKSHSRILIRDSAGMGKSTILRRIFLKAIDEVDNGKVNIKLPFLVDLRRLHQHSNLEDMIKFELFDGVSKFDHFFSSLVDSGSFLFLFDGFDEIPKEKYEESIHQIKKFAEKYHVNKFIITSRDEPILGSLSSFQGFRIVGLSKKESYELIRKYGKCLLRFDSEKLIKELDEEKTLGLTSLLRNPLMVTLLVIAYEYKKRIPWKKTDYYEQVFDALFEKHDLTKNTSFDRVKTSGLGKFDFSSVLRYIAILAVTKLDGQIEFNQSEIENLISQSKEALGKTFSVDNFLYDILYCVPIFIKDGHSYRWAHKSFQDFYAATWLSLARHHQLEEIKKHILGNPDDHFNLIVLYFELDEMEVSEKIFKPFLSSLVKNATGEGKSKFKNLSFSEEMATLDHLGKFSIAKVKHQTFEHVTTFDLNGSATTNFTNNRVRFSVESNLKTRRVLDLGKACRLDLFKTFSYNISSDGIDKYISHKDKSIDYDFYKGMSGDESGLSQILNGQFSCFLLGMKIDINLCIKWLVELDERAAKKLNVSFFNE